MADSASADGDGVDASFAQPSAPGDISAHQLIVVDAAGSAVRSISLADRRVSTMIGAGPYEFGDANGKRDTRDCRIRSAICVDPRGLAFVADSYNGKIKALNLRSGELRALNLPYQLHEPAGISLAGERIVDREHECARSRARRSRHRPDQAPDDRR